MNTEIQNLDLPLERDIFLRVLVRELSGVLEGVVGLDQAKGFISVVGQNMGDWINQQYCAALNVDKLTREQVAQVLVDLKKRIQGEFFLISEDDEKLVFGNTRCPFGDKVVSRTSLCMMTSNVFGLISADNLGYAKVALEQTIAQGHPQCRVVVYLTHAAAQNVEGNEYFQV